DNAIDFSPQGGELRVTLKRVDHQLVWSVQDQGPGIPPYAQDRIFERFYSLPRGDAQEKSSGLGLCLVREVSDLHGGQIQVQNRADGTGCVAFWRLPV
ncbi:MAG: ATP-binding protein, partial [Hydrogenophaga sp.]|nr:ATP-binding protein [Hydrogenophaga sp.]